MDISILVPVYQAEKTVENTLRCLLEQPCDGFSFEVVALNDGSRDGSLSKMQALQACYPPERLRVLTQENRGVARTRNRLLQEARGEYVLFVDADDTLEEGALSFLYHKAKESGARMVVFDLMFVSESGESEYYHASDAPEGPLSRRDYMFSAPGPCNKLIERALFCDHGLVFAPDLWYEDLAVIPALGRFVGQGEILYCKKPFYRYFQSQDSITRSRFSERRLDIFPALSALKENMGECRDEAEYLAWYHLYQSFVWIFWRAGRLDAIRRAAEFLKEQFPRWRKNPYIRSRHSRKERLVAELFYRRAFWLIRLWKGKEQ